MCANLIRCAFILYLIRSVWSQGPYQITFSSNPLYSGDPVTLTVSYGSGNLLSVSVDAFDGSLKKGSLSYVAAPLSCSGVGMFAGQTFTGWQNHPTSATNISVTLTATPSLELNYNCTAKVFNGGRLDDGTCAPAFLEVRGPFQITFSSNPLYIGDPVTLTVFYGSGNLLSVSVDAFDGSLKKGSLSYVAAPLSCSGVGVFAGKTFTGWQTHAPYATNISVTLTATPSLELNYTCTAKVFNGGSLVDGTCDPASLEVRVCPSTPIFQPDPIAFIDSDKGTIVCESRNGKPAALILLTATDIRGARLASGNFSDSAPLVLPPPLSNWHNATVTCSVLNHNCSNMSVTRGVFIRFNVSAPDVVCINESNVVLNCSKHIWSYPGFVYKWTIPAEANVTGRLDLESLTVLQGQSGTFNCTATNNYSMASVVISFTVSNVCLPITTSTDRSVSPPPSCENCYIIGVVLGIIVVVVIAVVLGILCKRGLLLKSFFRRTSTSASARRNPDVCATERSKTAELHSVDREYASLDTQLHSVDREYDSLDTQRSSEPTYAQLVPE